MSFSEKSHSAEQQKHSLKSLGEVQPLSAEKQKEFQSRAAKTKELQAGERFRDAEATVGLVEVDLELARLDNPIELIDQDGEDNDLIDHLQDELVRLGVSSHETDAYLEGMRLNVLSRETFFEHKPIEFQNEISFDQVDQDAFEEELADLLTKYPDRTDLQFIADLHEFLLEVVKEEQIESSFNHREMSSDEIYAYIHEVAKEIRSPEFKKDVEGVDEVEQPICVLDEYLEGDSEYLMVLIKQNHRGLKFKMPDRLKEATPEKNLDDFMEKFSIESSNRIKERVVTSQQNIFAILKALYRRGISASVLTEMSGKDAKFNSEKIKLLNQPKNIADQSTFLENSFSNRVIVNHRYKNWLDRKNGTFEQKPRDFYRSFDTTLLRLDEKALPQDLSTQDYLDTLEITDDKKRKRLLTKKEKKIVLKVNKKVTESLVKELDSYVNEYAAASNNGKPDSYSRKIMKDLNDILTNHINQFSKELAAQLNNLFIVKLGSKRIGVKPAFISNKSLDIDYECFIADIFIQKVEPIIKMFDYDPYGIEKPLYLKNTRRGSYESDILKQKELVGEILKLNEDIQGGAVAFSLDVGQENIYTVNTEDYAETIKYLNYEEKIMVDIAILGPDVDEIGLRKLIKRYLFFERENSISPEELKAIALQLKNQLNQVLLKAKKENFNNDEFYDLLKKISEIDTDDTALTTKLIREIYEFEENSLRNNKGVLASKFHEARQLNSIANAQKFYEKTKAPVISMIFGGAHFEPDSVTNSPTFQKQLREQGINYIVIDSKPMK